MKSRLVRIPALVAFAISTFLAAKALADSNKQLGQLDFTHGGRNALSGASLSMYFQNFAGVVVDSNGHLYVSDTGNNRILGWQTASSFTSGQSADLVIGQPDFGSITANQASGNVPTNSRLNQPAGLALDSGNNLYVADQSNNRVCWNFQLRSRSATTLSPASIRSARPRSSAKAVSTATAREPRTWPPPSA